MCEEFGQIRNLLFVYNGTLAVGAGLLIFAALSGRLWLTVLILVVFVLIGVINTIDWKSLTNYRHGFHVRSRENYPVRTSVLTTPSEREEELNDDDDDLNDPDFINDDSDSSVSGESTASRVSVTSANSKNKSPSNSKENQGSSTKTRNPTGK